MATAGGWNAQEMFDLYLLDYMAKKNMHRTATIFRKEAKVIDHHVAIDSPEGFLHEWWSIFSEIYLSRQPPNLEPEADASVEATKILDNQLQNIHATLPQLTMYQQRPGQIPKSPEFEKLFSQPDASLLAAKNYEEEQLRRDPANVDSISRLFDVNKPTLLKSIATSSNSSHLQQCIHGLDQRQFERGQGYGIHSGKNVSMDPILCGTQKAILPVSGTHAEEINRVNQITLDGWPLEVLNSHFQAPSYQQHIPMLTAQHRADALAQRLLNLPKNLTSDLEALSYQPYFPMLTAQSQPDSLAQGLSYLPRNPTSTFPGSPVMVNYHNLTFQEGDSKRNSSTEMIVQMRKTEKSQKQNDEEQEQDGRKKKKLSNLRIVDKTENCSKAEDTRTDDETMESFLFHDDENVNSTSTSFSNLRRHSTSCNKSESKGFSFEEVGCLRSSKNKVLCCHFSSNGKLLATAGLEQKVRIWNMETFDFGCTPKGHTLLITDVRFTSSSTIFATSSFDKTVQIWDAASVTIFPLPRSKSLVKLVGHADQVMSLDFHPRKSDLLCSCDGNGEIRLWNINQNSCVHKSKGATKQVRFQPQIGKLIATAAVNDVNIIDVETDSLQFCLRGHSKEVLSVCWDSGGNYLASISEDSARVWSASDGKCLHKLQSNGNKFQSCVFHPGYSQVLVIGGYQYLELWNPVESNKTMAVEAHKGLIYSLADNLKTETIASASHDRCVKLWK